MTESGFTVDVGQCEGVSAAIVRGVGTRLGDQRARHDIEVRP